MTKIIRLTRSVVFLVILFTVMFAAKAADNQLHLKGDFIQGGLVFGQIAPSSKILINDHVVRVSPNGEFIIGFGRDHPEQTTIKVIYKDGTSYQQILDIQQRKYKIQRIDGLSKEQVSPNQKAMIRIKREQAEIRKARDLDEDRQDFKQGFIWPVKGPITGVYGSQRILNGEPRQPHYGIDVAAPTGTAVVAPAAGRVTYAENMYFSGWTLVLDHGHRLSSSFLHLDKILVQVGDYVEQGETIALVGATGRVTGAHLDWRMNWYAQRIDPGLLMTDK